MTERATDQASEIVVNGERRAAPPGTTLARFLQDVGLDPDLVVVERNGAIVARKAFGSTALEHDDELEIVHFVGGG